MNENEIPLIKAKKLILDKLESQYRIAKETGINQSMLSKLNLGTRDFDKVNYNDIKKLADFYDQIKKQSNK